MSDSNKDDPSSTLQEKRKLPEDDEKPSAADNESRASRDSSEHDDDEQREIEGVLIPKFRKRRKVSEVEISAHNNRWNEMFEKLVKYKEKYGNCLVPNRYHEDPPLGHWVSSQRRQYKTVTSGQAGATAMTVERAKKLMSIGFEWSTTDPRHVPWEARYQELCDFVQKHGHAEVPMRWRDNIQLSNWVSKQRHDYKLRRRGTSQRLTDERYKLLSDIGFIWEATTRLDGAPPKPREKKSNDNTANSETAGIFPPPKVYTPPPPEASESQPDASGSASTNNMAQPQLPVLDPNTFSSFLQALNNLPQPQQQSSSGTTIEGTFQAAGVQQLQALTGLMQTMHANNAQGPPGQQQSQDANATALNQTMTGNLQNGQQQQPQNINNQANGQATGMLAGINAGQLQSVLGLMQNLQSHNASGVPGVIALPFLTPTGSIGFVPILNSAAGQQLTSLLPGLGGAQAQGVAVSQQGSNVGTGAQESLQQPAPTRTAEGPMQSIKNEPQEEQQSPHPYIPSYRGTGHRHHHHRGRRADPPGADAGSQSDDDCENESAGSGSP